MLDANTINLLELNEKLKSDLKQANISNQQLQINQESIKQSNETLKARYDTLFSEKQFLQQELQQLQKQKNQQQIDLSNQIQQLEKQILEIQDEMEQKQSVALPSINKEIIKMKYQQELQINFNYLLEQKDIEMEKYKTQNFNLKRTVQLLQARYEAIKLEAEYDIKSLRDKQDDQIKEFELEIESLIDKNQEKKLEQLIKQYKFEIEQLKNELIKEKQKEEKHQIIFDLTEELNYIRDEKLQLKDQLENSENSNEQLKDHLTKLTTRQNQFESKEGQFGLQNNESDHDKIQQNYLQEFEIQIGQLQDQNEELNKENKKLKAGLKNERIQKENAKLEEIQKELSETRKMLQKLEKEKIFEDQKKDNSKENLEQIKTRFEEIEQNQTIKNEYFTKIDSKTGKPYNITNLLTENQKLKSKLRKANKKIMGLLSQKFNNLSNANDNFRSNKDAARMSEQLKDEMEAQKLQLGIVSHLIDKGYSDINQRQSRNVMQPIKQHQVSIAQLPYNNAEMSGPIPQPNIPMNQIQPQNFQQFEPQFMPYISQYQQESDNLQKAIFLKENQNLRNMAQNFSESLMRTNTLY